MINRKQWFVMAGLCALGVASGGVLAADEAIENNEEVRLKEVVVTATKTEKDTADAPATVSIVTDKDIAKKNIHSVDEALTHLPGVYASRRSGHQPSVMGTNALLRGIPDYSRTLVLVDGQTLNDPYIGAVAWESVPPETVERIEVVPGPFSSLYGGSAIGGVVNIITKAPVRREVSIKAGYGTNALKTGTLLLQDRLPGGLGVVLNHTTKESGGYEENEVVKTATDGAVGTPVSGWEPTTDPSGNPAYVVGDKGDVPWESSNTGIKLYYDLSADSHLNLGASYFSYEKGRDRFNTYLVDAAGNPVYAGTITFNDNGVDKTMTLSEKDFLNGPNPKEQYRYNLGYDTKLAGGSELKLQLGYVDIPTYDYIIPFSSATYDNGGSGKRLHRPNNELSGSVQVGTAMGQRHYVVAGVATSKREIRTYEYMINDWRDADATDTLQVRTYGEDQNNAVYVQDEIYFSDRMTGYLGGRYDSWSTEGYLEQVSGTPSKDYYDSRSQSYFSPKLSLVYRPVPATTLRTSAGKAFRPPVLRDTFGWWTPASGYDYVPNPDLKPETSTAWEFGVEQRLGRTTLLRATYYENYLDDLIYRTRDDAALLESVENAGAAEVKGVELELRQRLTRGLSAFVNYTYNDAKITDNPVKPETEGKQMTRTPERLANIGIEFERGLWSAALMGHYVSKVYANDENLDTVEGVYGSYDSYAVADAKLAYRLGNHYKLSLAVDNLTDLDYYESYKAMGRAYYFEIAAHY